MRGTTYRECLDMLADEGVWAPNLPGTRNPMLCRGNSQQSQPIRGIYLNAAGCGRAYFTLLPVCKLKPDGALWDTLPGAEDVASRNVAPHPSRELVALWQLFGIG